MALSKSHMLNSACEMHKDKLHSSNCSVLSVLLVLGFTFTSLKLTLPKEKPLALVNLRYLSCLGTGCGTQSDVDHQELLSSRLGQCLPPSIDHHTGEPRQVRRLLHSRITNPLNDLQCFYNFSDCSHHITVNG